MENAIIMEIDTILMSSSSSSSSDEDEEAGRRQVHIRRPYRMMKRAKIECFDDVDFRKYFRINKNAFSRLLDLVRDDIEGDPNRWVPFNLTHSFHITHISAFILVHVNCLPKRNCWQWYV